MSWQQVILEQHTADSDLAEQVERLFAQQLESWPLLRDGVAALGSAKSKVLTDDVSQVILQENPGRKASTHAKVDAKTIAKRPCFLCPENFPPEERGIAFDDLVILPNPFPILAKHCTIPYREHTPQRLDQRIGTMLNLARALGPEMLVFYNGPKCGASAPDHFHFQACSAENVPLLAELSLDEAGLYTRHQSFGRQMLVFVDSNPKQVEHAIRTAVDAWKKLAAPGNAEEPMLNLVVQHRSGRYVCVLFPRAAHRPACYFTDSAEQIAISPATLEMSGLLVCAVPEHFDRVDAQIARQIYEEVSIDAPRCAQLLEATGQR